MSDNAQSAQLTKQLLDQWLNANPDKFTKYDAGEGRYLLTAGKNVILIETLDLPSGNYMLRKGQVFVDSHSAEEEELVKEQTKSWVPDLEVGARPDRAGDDWDPFVPVDAAQYPQASQYLSKDKATKNLAKWKTALPKKTHLELILLIGSEGSKAFRNKEWFLTESQKIIEPERFSEYLSQLYDLLKEVDKDLLANDLPAADIEAAINQAVNTKFTPLPRLAFKVKFNKKIFDEDSDMSYNMDKVGGGPFIISGAGFRYEWDFGDVDVEFHEDTFEYYGKDTSWSSLRDWPSEPVVSPYSGDVIDPEDSMFEEEIISLILNADNYSFETIGIQDYEENALEVVDFDGLDFSDFSNPKWTIHIHNGYTDKEWIYWGDGTPYAPEKDPIHCEYEKIEVSTDETPNEYGKISRGVWKP